MAAMMSVKEAAELWNLSIRRVTVLCREGRIAGATLEKGRWQIPENTEKPVDKRVKTGAYRKLRSDKLPLPVGISDYKRASTQYYYVDKTLLIRDFIDELPVVSLFTRPRRFGKTLSMDMLRTFFEKTDEDTSVYFRDKKIWKCGEKYRSYQGKYPVIFFGEEKLLHAVWDTGLIQKHSGLVYTDYKEYADRLDTWNRRQIRKATRGWAREWFEDCAVDVRPYIRTIPEGAVLGQEFVDAHIALAELELRKAAYQLAKALNTIFG